MWTDAVICIGICIAKQHHSNGQTLLKSAVTDFFACKWEYEPTANTSVI